MKSCAVTGHRPGKLHLGSENSSAAVRLKQAIHAQLLLLYHQGIRCFYLGGALGVDLWAGEILLYMKEQEDCQDLEIVLAIPFQGYNLRWKQKDLERLARLREASSQTVIVCEDGSSPVRCYRTRNQYLVDHADCLLAVYDPALWKSGTGMTVRYGEKKGISILYLHPKQK